MWTYFKFDSKSMAEEKWDEPLLNQIVDDNVVTFSASRDVENTQLHQFTFTGFLTLNRGAG